jgi:hypothetical protein
MLFDARHPHPEKDCMDILRRNVPAKIGDAAIAILIGLLLSLLLVKSRVSVSVSVGLGAGLTAVYVSWDLLATTLRIGWCSAASIARNCWTRVLDKRSYRFGTKTLLLLMMVIAVMLTWYGNGRRKIADERRRFDGKWHVVNSQGTPTIVSGNPIVIGFDLAGNEWQVDPAHEPRWLDYYTPQGISHAIYQWEGSRLRIRQASVGFERPMSFEQDIRDIKIKPNNTAKTLGVTDFYLERLPK